MKLSKITFKVNVKLQRNRNKLKKDFLIVLNRRVKRRTKNKRNIRRNNKEKKKKTKKKVKTHLEKLVQEKNIKIFLIHQDKKKRKKVKLIYQLVVWTLMRKNKILEY